MASELTEILAISAVLSVSSLCKLSQITVASPSSPQAVALLTTAIFLAAVAFVTIPAAIVSYMIDRDKDNSNSRNF